MRLFFKAQSSLQIIQKARMQYLTHTLPSALKQNIIHPVPDKNRQLQNISFLVVDFETTGFEAKKNDIISIGWVEITNMQIDCASQKHFYIDSQKKINSKTAVINHIVPQMLRYGVTLHEAIDMLLLEAKDKVLVVHGKVIEKCFIDDYVLQHFNLPAIPLLWIDTLRIENWRAMQKGLNVSQDNRLGSARKRYNLPQYIAHNALIDSIASAELLLAQISHIYRHKKATFGHLYRISQ